MCRQGVREDGRTNARVGTVCERTEGRKERLEWKDDVEKGKDGMLDGTLKGPRDEAE